MSIRTVDITEWLDWERAGVDMTKPYEVLSSPYGETVSQLFATEGEAMAEHDAIAAMTGTYNTSWGEESVNTEATILHYVDSTHDVYTVTTTAGARLGYPAHAIRDTRAEAIAVASNLHAHRVANGAEGMDAVRVEHQGAVIWYIRDNGAVSL